MEKKIADLIPDAKTALDDLLESNAAKKDCWLLKFKSDELAGTWEQLTLDKEENRKRIFEKIKQLKISRWDLCLAFIGNIDWRGKKQLMAQTYFFKSDYEDGLICGSHVRSKFFSKRYEKVGGFLIQGGCKNDWLVATV